MINETFYADDFANYLTWTWNICEFFRFKCRTLDMRFQNILVLYATQHMHALNSDVREICEGQTNSYSMITLHEFQQKPKAKPQTYNYNWPLFKDFTYEHNYKWKVMNLWIGSRNISVSSRKKRGGPFVSVITEPSLSVKINLCA